MQFIQKIIWINRVYGDDVFNFWINNYSDIFDEKCQDDTTVLTLNDEKKGSLKMP